MNYAGLRHFVSSCSARVLLVDLESIFDQAIETNSVFWATDKVHFSARGYDAIGELIFKTINNFEVLPASALSLPCHCRGSCSVHHNSYRHLK